MADVFYLELEQLPDDAHVSTQCGDLQAGQLRCAVPRLGVRAALWQSVQTHSVQWNLLVRPWHAELAVTLL